jgi:glycerol uptake facilitator-like aquaporin
MKMQYTDVQSAIVTGFVAVATIYSFADVSGAHFNPAVTFATVVTRKTSVKKGLLYIGAQLLGSVFATMWIGFLFDFNSIQSLNVMPNLVGVKLAQAFLMETTLTFILCYVIFATAFDTVDSDKAALSSVIAKSKAQSRTKHLTVYNVSGTSKAGFAPIAIGFTLGFLTMIGGGVSGGAFNPARVFGPAFCTGHVFTEGYLWLYFIGDFIGAAAAGFTQYFFQTVKKFEGQSFTATQVINAFVPRELNRIVQH